jgi:uncharacterized protein (TIGR03083 family)
LHTGGVPTEVRTTFAAAARSLPGLVDRIPPGAWDGPGLGDWDLRALVGHTSRSLTTVLSYLERPAAHEDVPSAAAYYSFVARAIGADPAAVTERGRQAGIALGDQPALTIRALVDDALAALDDVTGDPVIETIAGGMRVDAYLPTRTFELAVHSLDIAAAIGIPGSLPADVLTGALQLAAEIATLRGDGEGLLLSLTGRRPLADGYSVV